MKNLFKIGQEQGRLLLKKQPVSPPPLQVGTRSHRTFYLGLSEVISREGPEPHFATKSRTYHH